MGLPDSWHHPILTCLCVFNQIFYFETIIGSLTERNTERSWVRMKVLFGIGNKGREKKRLEDEIKAVVFVSGLRTLSQTCREVVSVEVSG